MQQLPPLHIGIPFWEPNDGFGNVFLQTLRDLDVPAESFPHDAPIPPDCNALLVYGPFGSLVPLANQLRHLPEASRPALLLFQTEQFPNPRWPEWARYTLSLSRSWVERLAYRSTTTPHSWLTRLIRKGHRFRYYGDLYWLRREGLLTLLITDSYYTENFLRQRGFNPLLSSIGNHSDWGTDLGLERDIPVLWLGKPGSRRRARLLRQLRTELQQRGVNLLMVDGIEHPYVFGHERTVLLNRSKITLNLLRQPWDDNSMRFYLAAVNGTLVVSEPMLPHSPFVDGQHLIVAPLAQLADTICYYLEHEAERQQLTNQARHFVLTELTMRNSMIHIIAELERKRPYQHQPPTKPQPGIT
ncbi:MAG: glycosyltransferase family 1 protein [Ardenticatenaceae bacterium]|nr:glycosyltransferase family 1 protein [Anaerolineales bacterium]MCB8921332.1 glycosyltransferase family 1 protein [Ardenticatenaceae bacterium]MCB9004045.1 glycosyltransferase family 1 protein [Ardenticatenaceae bacterium]